jgi:acetate CoA/acetoacetate CoA-transferase beta subunit
MDDKELIAKRVALELRSGNLVNLGIGLPQSVANYLPASVEVFFQSENGIIGMEVLPEIGMEDPYLTDAGGRPIGAVPGACSFDSCISFGLIRGGHLDVTVLGGLQVDERGRLANWTIPGKMIPGMGGAMDLVTGTKRVIVAMTHAVNGKSKIVKQCTLPLTSIRPVNLVITELAVIEPSDQGLVLKERAPGVTVEKVMAATEALLIIPSTVPEMAALERRA